MCVQKWKETLLIGSLNVKLNSEKDTFFKIGKPKNMENIL